MNLETLDKAIEEAHRFLRAALHACTVLEADAQLKREKGPLQYRNTGPSNAAARRASMDLTRALAKLRKP